MKRTRVKSLIQQANPAPQPALAEDRAELREGLAALVGRDPGTGVPEPPAARQARSVRPHRRGVLFAGLALGAAAAVATVAVITLDNSDGREPGQAAAGEPTREKDRGNDSNDSTGGLVPDELSYSTTAELEGTADLIVRARPGTGKEADLDGYAARTTLTPAKVLATAKGEATGKSIQIAHTTPGSGPEATALTKSKEYVLLLDRQDDGRYTLVNTTQGVYKVTRGRAVAGEDNDVPLSRDVTNALGLEP
ncbi:hypothetical protein [Streptomyces jumonjinensis]|uniref:hypothetical protein n=1 Tax=Streptomyces jumonjinensis TaxID=1945 RepID=UPI0037AC9FAD